MFFDLRNIADLFFCDMPVRFRDDVGIVPYGKDGGMVGRWEGKPVPYGKDGGTVGRETRPLR